MARFPSNHFNILLCVKLVFSYPVRYEGVVGVYFIKRYIWRIRCCHEQKAV